MQPSREEKRSAIVETFRLATLLVTLIMLIAFPFVLYGLILAGLYIAGTLWG